MLKEEITLQFLQRYSCLYRIKKLLLKLKFYLGLDAVVI